MFDIGFTELLVIGVVALLVVGPERLPKVARTAGHLFGRMQRYVSSVKADISQEMELDELRKAGQAFKESVESKIEEAEYTMRDEVVNPVEEAAKTLAEAEPETFPAEHEVEEVSAGKTNTDTAGAPDTKT